jgi:hypothetical protein
MNINLNATVSITLTEHGAAVLNNWNQDPAVPSIYWSKTRTAGEVLVTQLWEVMQVFGPSTCLGMPGPHFENNEITLIGA